MASASASSIQLEKFLATNEPILDVRKLSHFQQAHINGSAHIESNELQERQYELSKPQQPIRLVCCKSTKQAAINFLAQKNYQINQLLEWNDNTIPLLKKMALLASGNASHYLWKPTDALPYFLSLLNAKNIVFNNSQPKVLDVACGTGRDLVYLGLNGWSIYGVDYLSAALEKYQKLAQRLQLEAHSFQIDLEKNIHEFDAIEDKFELVQVFRYLHRPLLERLQAKIAVGGFLIYQTFYQGVESFGKPKKARFILKAGELAHAFSDFDIWEDSVINLDDGRPTNLFIARKTK